MNKKILIVEDEETQIVAMSESLTKNGFEVLVASNGKEGLDKALKEHPDLILLDIVMPIMSGMEMLKELRKDEWGVSVPVILLTNVDDIEKVAEGLGEDVLDYIIKSDLNIDKVVERINNKLKINT